MRPEYDNEKPHSTGNYRGNFRGNYHNRPFYYNRRPFRGKIRPNYIRNQGGFRVFNNKYEKQTDRQERSRTRSRSRERSRSRSSSSERINQRMRSRRSYSRHSDRSESSCEDKRNPSGQRTSYDHRTRDHTPEHQRGNKSATSPDSVPSHKGSNSPRSRHSVSDNRNSRHSRSRSRERGPSRSSSHDFTYKPQVAGNDPDIGSSPTMSRRSDSSSARNSGEPSDPMSSYRLPRGSRMPEQTNQTQGKLAHDMMLAHGGALTLAGQTLPVGSMFLLDSARSTSSNSTNACNLMQKVNMATILSSSPQKADIPRNYGNYMSPPLSSRYMEANAESSSPDVTVLSNGDHTDKGKHRLDSGLPSPSLTSKLNGLGPDKISQIREKKEEIEQAYKQDCETFATVVKMLISKEPSLEDAIQPSLRQNLRDIGARCIQELQDYIDQVRKDSGLK
ncbi:periphilin-1-like isoform X1 [Lineus longissimus]|uniref:periphilin-1-like isoform X1 n=1 Tax=Lineus longissimus TaxID=88925 RepID=UPI002B4ED645